MFSAGRRLVRDPVLPSISMRVLSWIHCVSKAWGNTGGVSTVYMVSELSDLAVLSLNEMMDGCCV